ncbi:MAG: acyl-CoA dehydrogenase family protein [Alphaproteobacteria bacterium]|nr:acyl-CoA dehydrogenase family protein [Alphaproteobacteria bacterium]
MTDHLTDAQAALRARARTLAQEKLAAGAAERDRSEAYPWDAARLLGAEGFTGMTVPAEFGGRGLGYFETVLAIEEFAKACGASARIVVEANMGAIGAIMRYGTEAQKRLAARLVLAGDKPAICITEPEAGSAATDMSTRAERQGDHYLISGRKHWITGGGVSRLHLVFARVIENGAEQGIGGFIVLREGERDNEGFPPGMRLGVREPAMGLRAIPETELVFDGLKVPAGMLLAPPGGIRRGFAALMDAYNSQRVGAATVALGIAAGAFEQALAYAQSREQFGRPIAEFQGLQWMLADMATEIEAARALVWRAARSTGPAGFPDPMAAAQAKLFASEMAIRVTNSALQVWGAAGYSRRNPMERYVRDARMFAIAGGTAQILRNQVAARLLNRRLPQTRDGYLKEAAKRKAAE